MKRFLLLAAILAPLAIAGCSDLLVVAEATINDEETGERVPLGDLPIRLLPYDRDAIFDSLQTSYSEPEPPIPPEILAQRQQVQEAQTAWRNAEERWTIVRDSLRSLSDQLTRTGNQGLDTAPPYAGALDTLEAEERVVLVYAKVAAGGPQFVGWSIAKRFDMPRRLRERDALAQTIGVQRARRHQEVCGGESLHAWLFSRPAVPHKRASHIVCLLRTPAGPEKT